MSWMHVDGVFLFEQPRRLTAYGLRCLVEFHFQTAHQLQIDKMTSWGVPFIHTSKWDIILLTYGRIIVLWILSLFGGSLGHKEETRIFFKLPSQVPYSPRNMKCGF